MMFDKCDGVARESTRSTKAIRGWQQQRSGSYRLLASKHSRALRVASYLEPPRVPADTRCQSRLCEHGACDTHATPMAVANDRDGFIRPPPSRITCGLEKRPQCATDGETHRGASNHDRARACDSEARAQNHPAAPAAELIAIAPRRELGPQRSTDSYELSSFFQASQPDIGSRDAEGRRTKGTFASLDRLPTLFQRREIPPLAAPTHHPQSPLLGVERQPPSDGEVLYGFICAKQRVAENAVRVHRTNVPAAA